MVEFDADFARGAWVFTANAAIRELYNMVKHSTYSSKDWTIVRKGHNLTFEKSVSMEELFRSSQAYYAELLDSRWRKGIRG